MAKVKSSEISHYELLYIISNKYSENEIKPILEKVDNLIIKQGGQITFQEDWGKKKLAYSIKHFKHGYYYLREFDLEGEKLAEIDNNLRLAEEILRHQIIKKKKETEEERKQKLQNMASAEKRQEEEKQAEETKENIIKEKEEIKQKTENIIDKTTEENKEETTTVAEDKDKKQKEDKNDFADLDNKLDKILDTDSLL